MSRVGADPLFWSARSADKMPGSLWIRAAGEGLSTLRQRKKERTMHLQI